MLCYVVHDDGIYLYYKLFSVSFICFIPFRKFKCVWERGGEGGRERYRMEPPPHPPHTHTTHNTQHTLPTLPPEESRTEIPKLPFLWFELSFWQLLTLTNINTLTLTLTHLTYGFPSFFTWFFSSLVVVVVGFSGFRRQVRAECTRK